MTPSPSSTEVCSESGRRASGYWLRLACALALGALALGCQSTALTAAKLYIKQEKPGEAKEQLLQALQTEPENAEIHYLLGTLYGQEEDFESMVASFERSLELSSKFAAPIDEHRRYHWIQSYNKGIRFARANSPDFEAANRAFGDATLIDPSKLEAWRNLAFVRYQVDDVDGAVEVYRYIAAEAPTDTVTCNSLGVLLLGEGRAAEAAEAFEQVLALDPSHSGALINLAVVYTDEGRSEEAEALYRRAAEVDPEAAQPHHNLGNLYWNQKRYNEAAEAYRAAVERDPEDADSRFNLAVTYLSLDDPAAALPLLQPLSEETPDNGSVWRELGRTWALLGKVRESERAYGVAEQLGEFGSEE